MRRPPLATDCGELGPGCCCNLRRYSGLDAVRGGAGNLIGLVRPTHEWWSSGDELTWWIRKERFDLGESPKDAATCAGNLCLDGGKPLPHDLTLLVQGDHRSRSHPRIH